VFGAVGENDDWLTAGNVAGQQGTLDVSINIVAPILND